MLDGKPMHLRKYVDRKLFALFYVGNHYLNFYGAFLHSLHSLKDKSKVELQFLFPNYIVIKTSTVSNTLSSNAYEKFLGIYVK